MKRNQIVKAAVITGMVIAAGISRTEVKFADRKIQEDFNKVHEQFEEVRSFFAKLDSSSLIYTIRYGKLGKHVDGAFETDGENLFITLRKKGQYSLQTRFVHEATHAQQFEQGRIGFVQDAKGTWNSINYDLSDEVEAYTNMISVANNSDLNGTMDRSRPKVLAKFKQEMDDRGHAKAVAWLNTVFKDLSQNDKNNFTVAQEIINQSWEKKGFKFFYIPFTPLWARAE
ncbi:hypothetical protein BVY01_01975 [bacterium I07]|nr:hypothetical protein BVY01_01975 [bacterium I07]